MSAPHWPAEWAPQAGVLVTWPRRDSDWGRHQAAAETTFAGLVSAITQFEPALVIVADRAHRIEVAARLQAAASRADRVVFAELPSNDAWARDHGPLTVIDAGGARLVHPRFDGWGGRYAADLDSRIPKRLFDLGVVSASAYQELAINVEGGALETDGAGTLLATARSLTGGTRNAGHSAEAVVAALAPWLGVQRTHLLAHGGLVGDDTDGHIDTLARFAPNDTIVYSSCDEPTDANFEALQAMAAELKALRTREGRPYNLVPLPIPAPCYGPAGDRLPANYANFLVINSAVIVPVHDDPMDTVALARINASFSDRHVVALPALPLLMQHGSIHCVTMHLPEPLQLAER